MKIPSRKTALAPGNGYVCLSCRLRLPATSLQIQRLQHADTLSSNAEADQVRVDLDKTVSQNLPKDKSQSSSLSSSGKSKGVLPSTPGRLKFMSPQKPSREAKKLQLSLHEKFVAQRRRDAISLQFPNGRSGGIETILTQEPEKEPVKKPNKILAKKNKPETRREVKRNLAAQRSTVKPSSGSNPSQELQDGKEESSKSTPSNESNNVEDRDTGQNGLAGLGNSLRLDQALKANDAANEHSTPEILSQNKKPAKKKKISKPPKQKKKTSKPPKGKKPYVLTASKAQSSKKSESLDSETPSDIHRTAAEDKRIKSKGQGRSVGAGHEVAVNIRKVSSNIQKVSASELEIIALDIEQPPVRQLSYGLERVLFNPGVYHLQDPRSRVFNFDPYLQTIMPVAEFNYDALKEYVTSSKDKALQDLAESHNKRYVGSSSSMTSILAHFHFLLSQWRAINTNMLSRDFPEQHVTRFTELQRIPSAIFLKWRNGSYAIDADKEFSSSSVLMHLGKSMEKLLTLRTEDFERYRKSSSERISAEEQNAPESFHYSTMGDFLMRSQLDAHDPRLPGTGMFDLKTRAVVSVRMDTSNYEGAAGYQIKTRQGAWESFEREYFDMIRSAFLKYSLQVRMGRMDGIFVAFHNTDRIFGFQYISLSEMDSTIHGQWDTTLGDQEFKLSISLLNDVLNKATEKYPETSLRLHFETREVQTPFMYIFVEPVTEEHITAIQTANDAEIREYEREKFGISESVTDGEAEDQGWENLQANVQDAMDEDIRDPNHNDGRQDLNPVMTDANAKVQSTDVSSQSGTPVGSESDPTAAAVEDDDDEDSDPDEDEEGEEQSEDEGEDEDDEDDGEAEEEDGNENEVDDDEIVPNGILVERAVGEDVVGQTNVGKNIGAQGHETPAGQGGAENADAEEEYQPEAQAAGEGGENGLDYLTGDTSEMESDETIPSGTTHASLTEPETVQSSEGNAETKTKSEEGETDQDDGAKNPEPHPGDDSPAGADVPFIERMAQEKPNARPAGKEVLALTLTVRNKVNKAYVQRPENLDVDDKWSMEYWLDEVSSPDRAWKLYQACQQRRRKKMDDMKSRSENDDEVDAYVRMLRRMSRQGAQWRKQQDKKDKASPVKVLGQDFFRKVRYEVPPAKS
ncbi:MAG: hypothetical protein Q9200_004058 [Gallowayella weberi]